MAIGGRVAVSRKMFGGNQDAIVGIRVRAVDVGGNLPADVVGIFAVSAHVDDGIFGIAVDVGDRREHPMHSHRASLSGGLTPFELRFLEIVGGSVGHVVGEPYGVA